MTVKRIWQVAAGCLSMVLWSFAIGFDIRMLLSLRDFVLVVIGAVLLTLPVFRETKDKREIWRVFKKQLIISGYLASFILIFADVTEPKTGAYLSRTVALCLRPALYGFVCNLLLGVDEEKKKPEQNISRREILRSVGLTLRETEIAIMICKKMTNREIDEELYIFEATVKKHVSHIFVKLEIDNRDEIDDVIAENSGQK